MIVPPTMVATTGPSRGSGASCWGFPLTMSERPEKKAAMRTAYEERRV
ncbi:hypothetical protein SHIRM173S_09182 [Streptomyces hirsutus]